MEKKISVIFSHGFTASSPQRQPRRHPVRQALETLRGERAAVMQESHHVLQRRTRSRSVTELIWQ
jgi:hypothetical protein